MGSSTTYAHGVYQPHGCRCTTCRLGPQRIYIPGRAANLRGPRRRTVAEPDEVAVDLYLGGDWGVRLAKVERDALIDRVDCGGRSAGEVAKRIGVTQRTVQRRRAARRGEVSTCA